jgi:hypothetical protein
VEVAVRESSGTGRCRGSLGRLKWSVLDAAGERGCEKVILSPAAERGGKDLDGASPSGAFARDVPGQLRTFGSRRPGK